MSREIDARTAPTTPFEPGPQHELLAAMAGDWSGPTQTWFDPDGLPEECTTEASARLLLGGRWLRIDYRGEAMGKLHAGEMTLGFHRDAKQFEMAWIDSFHTGSQIMSFAGPLRDDGEISVLGSYQAGAERWGWRTAYRLEAPGTLVVRAWNITPDGQEQRAIETRLTRR